MSAVPKSMSLDDFVLWEERQDGRFEFDGVNIQAMTGGTLPHGRIQSNLIGSLYARLRGGPCFVIGSELKIKTESSIRYPDAMVICTRIEGRPTWTSAPAVIFEVLSPSTARKDLGAKNAEYQTLETLKRYVALHQTVAAAEVFFRDAEGEWQHEFVGGGETLRMPEIGVELPLSACYEGLELSA